nr:glycosyltransferase family A protein [uncultured Sphingobacterium sp.]
MLIDSPVVSIIIPLYNKEETIKNTVSSVFRQEYSKFELLIVDDGSTDNSIKLLSEITDPRLVIITKANGGVSDARNFGIKHARGKCIFFLDADDLITTDCLSIFVGMLDRYTDESVYVCNFKITSNDNSGIVYCREKKERLFTNPIKALWERRIFPRTGAMMIKKTCFDEIGFFPINMTVYEDLEFILRLLNKYSVVYNPAVLLSYQSEYNSLSKKPVALSKEFAFYADFTKKARFEKFILADLVYSSYRKRLKIGDTHSTKILFERYKKHLPILVIALIHKNLVTTMYKMGVIRF